MAKLLINNGEDKADKKVIKEVFDDFWLDVGEDAFKDWAKNNGIEERFTEVSTKKDGCSKCNLSDYNPCPDSTCRFYDNRVSHFFLRS